MFVISILENLFSFPVHRKLVARSSEFFKALLGPNFKEGAEDKITLKSVDGPTLKKIIHYIYIGQIELNKDNIENVLAAASGMEIVSLEEKCAEHLKESLTGENCLQTLILADKYNLLQLKANAFDLVCAKFENIPMADMMNVDSNILNDILKCDQIQAAETQIFNCVVEWVQQDETERAKFAPELLKLIRLEHMPTEVKLTIFNQKYFLRT